MNRLDQSTCSGFSFSPPDSRRLQKVVDQFPHALCRSSDSVQVVAAFGVELVGVIFQQGLAEAVDTAKRRPQIMRDTE